MSSRSPYRKVTLPIRTGGSFEAKAKRYLISGHFVDVCSSSALTKMLKVDLNQLRKLETRGFPASLWRMKNAKRWNRWYSTKQINIICELAVRCSVRGRLRTKPFIEAVRKVFYVIDIPAKELENE